MFSLLAQKVHYCPHKKSNTWNSSRAAVEGKKFVPLEMERQREQWETWRSPALQKPDCWCSTYVWRTPNWLVSLLENDVTRMNVWRAWQHGEDSEKDHPSFNFCSFELFACQEFSWSHCSPFRWLCCCSGARQCPSLGVKASKCNRFEEKLFIERRKWMGFYGVTPVPWSYPYTYKNTRFGKDEKLRRR